MNKTAIFYSFNTVKTAKVAEKIIKAFGENDIDAINIENIDDEKFTDYDTMILGVSTWWDGELPNYWDEFVPAIEDMTFKDKKVAIFGLGDQVGYPENFADAIGIIAELLEERGAKIIGFTSTEGYTYERSKAIRKGKFLGLALDQENQGPLTNERVLKWVEQVKIEFNED